MRILWQNPAKIELKEAVQYYRANAGDFRDEARRVTRQLLEHPEIGLRIHHEVRRYPLHDYPFNIIYRLTPEAIIIVALAHQSRRPGYWTDRR
ncbi:MAG: type II toxin-antitoxin system RelE/ParE family toxin [Porticoccaceae bacterium]